MGFGIFWVLQAVSGALLVFQRELTDLTTIAPYGKDMPYTNAGLSIGIEKLKQTNPTHKPVFLINNSTSYNIFDLITETPEKELPVYRLSATTGDTYKTYYWEGSVSTLSFFRALHLFHTRLLAGNLGHWIIGLSGIFLTTSLALGLYIGWPRNRTAKHVLKPKAFKFKIASLYAWHRAVGLWCVFLLLFITVSGTIQVWQSSLRSMLGATHNPTIERAENSGLTLSLTDAINIAKQEFPGSALAMVSFPQASTPYYQVRLTQPDESRLVYGTTTLYISEQDGRILRIYNPLTTKSLKLKVFDALYPLHTGEFWGLTGRILYLIAAIGLVLLTVMGLSLWMLKSRRTTRKKITS